MEIKIVHLHKFWFKEPLIWKIPLKPSEFSVKVGFILSYYSPRNACLSRSVICCICILTLLVSTVPVIKSFCRHCPAERDHRPPSQWTLIRFGVYLTIIRSAVLAKSENPWSNHLTLPWAFKSEQPAFRALGMILSPKKEEIKMHIYSWQYICIFYYGFTILTALTEILRVKSFKEAEIFPCVNVILFKNVFWLVGYFHFKVFEWAFNSVLKDQYRKNQF